jgi:hypothetical protein
MKASAYSLLEGERRKDIPVKGRLKVNKEKAQKERPLDHMRDR